jgi:4-diphosphocytidyl-2-C-methyl-D-erythritol kinase
LPLSPEARLAGGSRSLTLWSPAKLNLFLEVLGKRPDGFHELETLMVPISLYDTLELTADRNPELRFACQNALGGAVPGVPTDRTNLACRAIASVGEAGASGVSLRLVKRIPSEAGLAGGSTDAAGALCGADALRDVAIDPATLAAKAAELGSDVPFFLAGEAAICRGRGERVTAVAGLAGLHFVVVKPPVGLSTAAVFRACRAATEHRSVEPLIAALVARDWARVRGLVFNRLEEASLALCPEVARLKRVFDGYDVAAHQMSGSGTSYFGLCRSARHARAIAGRVRSLNLGSVFVVRSL